ncbi:thioredoxin domain-containing protein [Hydrogenophaga sp.]|uniref:DsbA family protein n=1 Tax=Hydrogenophaga sp. TaxID=1904254 RepID=UPI002721AB09|nr:thioredoxin domain-containing protein [Hydrogenophaga sp.]MDO9436948.1 thioredoxin domain-containing protein [Hydrogenophaga sp.]
MNAKKIAIVLLLAALAAAFFIGMKTFRQQEQAVQENIVRAEATRLVRMHSPVLGAQNAPVTIVEFFDPACEACRAFYPFVKQLLAQYPTQVKVVIRYAPFHTGSDQVVQLLEAARRQGQYEAALEAVLAAQPQWADHHQPQPQLAWNALGGLGLNIAQARADAQRPEIAAALAQDVEDLGVLQVSKTPTFFVNGRSLPSFGPEQLAALVADEVRRTAAP